MTAPLLESRLRAALAQHSEAPRSAATEDVWASLSEIGVPLAHDGDRMRLQGPPVDWLGDRRLSEALCDNGPLPVRNLTLAFRVDSTNAQALAAPAPALGTCDVWIADYQSEGRGRREARWESPFASGLCITLVTSLSPRDDLAALPLVLGLAVRRALVDLGLGNVVVKWPNDILFGERKLGGILVESRHMSGRAPVFAMGLGLNVHAAPPRLGEQALPAACVRDAMGSAPGRHDVAVAVLRHWRTAISAFAQHGFGAFAAEWTNADGLFGRRIDVVDGTVVSGTACGVDAIGRLRLSTAHGERLVPCGAIRVRPVDEARQQASLHG